MNERSIPTRNVKPADDLIDKPVKFDNTDLEAQVKKTYDVIAEEKLTAFVNEQIDKMKAYTKLGHDGNPSFFEVNEALMSYHNTLLALLSIHHLAKVEHIRAKEAYDDWYAGKYIEIRDDVNPRSLAAQKWYSQKEIDMMVRQRNSDEYKRLTWNVTLTDQQLSFIRRMLDGWGSHQYVLTQLSKNLIAEVNGIGVGDSNTSAM